MLCQKCKKEIPAESVYCMFCGKRVGAPAPRKALKRPNGTGTAYKLSGRRARPWVTAKNGIILGYYTTKTEALEALSKVIRKPIDERYNMTLSDVYEAWQGEHFKTLTEKGIDMYKNAYKHLSPLYDRKMRSLHAEDYQTIIDRLIASGRSHSTTNKIKELCSQLSKWAMREDIIDKNYAQFIQLQKEAKAEKEVFTTNEIQILHAHDEDDTVKLILIMIYSGLRIGELLSLTKEAIHLSDGYMIGGSKTTAGIDRVVPISKRIEPYISHFYSLAPDGGLLIEGFDGNRTVRNFREREYYPTLERLKIARHTPHATRHTFASLMAGANVRPELLQKIIGHADYSTTANIYVHKNIVELKAAVDQI